MPYMISLWSNGKCIRNCKSIIIRKKPKIYSLYPVNASCTNLITMGFRKEKNKKKIIASKYDVSNNTWLINNLLDLLKHKKKTYNSQIPKTV